MLDSNDLPLGLFCDQQFTAVRTISGQDTLVIFTDGVSEPRIRRARSTVPRPCAACSSKTVSAARRHYQNLPRNVERFRGHHATTTKLCWQFSMREQERVQR